jgi:class 3 adenylate cyclase/tetratricopeptide (TPR) repeat protein/energy-coupling factor transporter ATP-binding protein EcfA2
VPQCLACGEQNPEGARFCSACGTALTVEPAVEERKVVSVLFVDLVDFTSRSDQADPEDVRAMLVPYDIRVKSEIESFGGLVEKFIGDAVMAVFGAQVSHGDDAERAVRAGLRVLDAIQELNKENPALDLTVRAAVNTGVAIVDARQQPDIAQGLAHGDVVNTASRLETGAPPGGLGVGAETYWATRSVIGYEPLEPIQAKGKRKPLAAWLALEALTGPAERAASAAPMVGRDRELALLRRTWESVTTQRRPDLVTVVGHPGIGKTRLTREFVGLVEPSGTRVLRGRSLPYGESSGYRAFRQQVKDVAGIFEGDPPADARAKLTAVVTELCGPTDGPEVADHLAVLIGLGGDRVADRQPLFFAARRFVEDLASRQPLLLVFEDIHWADTSQLDLLESLASRVRDVPVMFLALARPELLDSRPTWGAGLMSHTSMQLHPLSSDEARTLAGHLLPMLSGLQGAADRVVITAEGNPLFIEELVASLAERVDEALEELPTNVRSTIAARLDTLPAAARGALLDAAVIGKVFWRGALQALDATRSAAELEDALDMLESRDFIHRESGSQIQGDHEYLFKHMLIREVAYATLPRAARRERHAAVARFIESAAGERIEEAAALLAHHWQEAGDVDQAIRFLQLAAEHAAKGWAKDVAVALFGQALQLVPENQPELRRAIAIRRAETQVELGDPGAAAALDKLLEETEGLERLKVLMARAHTAHWAMDAEGATRMSQEAFDLAQSLSIEEFVGPALALQSLASSMDGNMDTSLELGVRALAKWTPGTRRAERALCLDQMATGWYWTGEYERALEYGEQAISFAEEIKSSDSLLRTGSVHALTLTGMGRHEEALPRFEEVIARGREFGLVPRMTARALNMSSELYRDLFQLDEATLRNQEAAELGAAAGFANAVLQSGIDQLFTDLARGEVGRAEARWPELWDRTQNTKGTHQWLMAGRLAKARAEIALAKGEYAEAARLAQEAIDQSREVRRAKYELAARVVLGQALMALGQPQRGIDELHTALRGIRRLGHPPTLWRAWWTLGTGLAQTGQDAEAAAAVEAAANTLRTFAATLAPERSEPLLVAEPSREILSAAGSR